MHTLAAAVGCGTDFPGKLYSPSPERHKVGQSALKPAQIVEKFSPEKFRSLVVTADFYSSRVKNYLFVFGLDGFWGQPQGPKSSSP